MRTTKQFLLMMLLCLWAGSMHAQVKIGEEVLPTKGAVLDLKKTETTAGKFYLGGLLLPNVEILDMGFIPASFTEADKMTDYDSSKGVDKNTALAGTIVYNTKPNEGKNIQVGIYMWDGEDWKLLSDGGSMKLEPDPGTFDKDGETKEIEVVNPGCTLPGDYTYVVIVGSAYASVNPESSADGKFSVTFDANPTAMERKAVVMVTDPCGKTATFVFTQGFDANLCDGDVTVPAIASYSGNKLCGGGAAYLYLNGSIGTNNPDDYIWTLGNVELGRGITYTATTPGTYIVYYKAIGCDNNSGGFALAPSGDTAPGAVRIIVNGNNGFVCSDTDVTTIIAQAAGAGSIRWFKDGVLQTGADYDGKEAISAGIGRWNAVVYDGGSCWSKPSDDAIVQLDPNAGTSVPTPEISVNGLTTGYSFCAGGMALLEVTNPSADVTRYTWYAENTEIGYGTSVYYNIPNDLPNVIIRCRAEGANCSTEALVFEQISITAAPAIPRISGLNVLCGGEATLTANSDVSDAEYIWYYGNPSATEATTLLTGKTGQNLMVTDVGIYQVAVKEGNCISRKSAVKRIELSDFVTLKWVQTFDAANYEETKLFEVQATNGPVTYKWEVTNATLHNTNGNRTSVVFPTTGTTATVKVTATNACGSLTLEQEVALAGGCTDPTIPTPSANQTISTVVNKAVKMPVMVQGGVSPTFQWYMDGTAMNTTTYPTAATATLVWTPTATGNYTFYCDIYNNCTGDVTSGTVTSKTYTVSVIGNPATLPPGSGTLTGKACFDIAFSNDNENGCAPLTSRTGQKSDFSLDEEQDPASGSTAPYTAKQVYTFTPTVAVTNVRFVAVYEDGDIVESVTPKADYSTVAAKTACKATVLYKESLNESLKGLTTTTGKKLNLYALYTYDSKEYSVGMTIRLQDCACCGAATIDGGWLNFMCHNLGADESLDPFTYVEGNADGSGGTLGYLYQWGRPSDNHQKRNSESTTTLATNNEATAPATVVGNFIKSGRIPYDWRSGGGNDSRWGDGTQNEDQAKADNDPCPKGWKVPSQKQWASILKGGTTSVSGAATLKAGTGLANKWVWDATTGKGGYKIGDNLYLPAAGYSGHSTATLYNVGVRGYYWSSTVNSTSSYYLYFYNTHVTPAGSGYYRATGSSVRCVAE